MAEAAVSMVLDQLAPLIGEKVRNGIDYLFSKVQEEDLQDLSYKLKRIQAVLADAERRGVTDPDVESWLDKLKDITYEIEDALDEWNVEVTKQQLQESGDASESSSGPPLKRVRYSLNFLGSWFKQPLGSRSLALDIKRINQRLDSIKKINDDEFKFIPNLGRKRQDFKRTSSTSFVEVSEIQGREDDKKTLVSKLLPESSGEGENGVKIVSIVGTGGMGKTTLAQFVFNTLEVKDHFDVKIWVRVSDPFDELKVAKSILRGLNKTSPNDSEFEALLQCINESILGKKFLLVLDDVWTEDDTKWEPIKVSLNSGARGSCILVTTRNEIVARKVGSTHVHSLKPLEDAYCWSILNKIAFYERPEGECKLLEEIGREIAKKCKGLPLAAKTLGGVLLFKSCLPEWESVLHSDMCNIKEVKKGIFPFLILSYDELDPAVKRCFSYCAIFEKDHDIGVDELIRMWMAQGYLCSSENATEMEVVGRQYFEDLAMRSFFQDFDRDGDGRIRRCKMHDIIHDFAQSLTKNECLIVPQTNGRERMVRSKDARHVNAINSIGEVPDALFPGCDVKRIRSLLLGTYFLPRPDGYHISPNLFSHLKRVRLLNLRHCGLQYISKEIGNLIHTRYLDISGNGGLAELPETICDLYNLQTFGMKHCSSLTQFPQGIHKLINLRHLSGVSGDFQFPQGFEKLTNLRTLGRFSATRSSGNQLGWLKDLNQLEGSLKIYMDDSVDEVEAKKADLKNKKLLRHLNLYCLDIERLEVVEALQPHPSLQGLSLWYAVSRLHLPKWIPTLTNLKRLDLTHFRLTNPGLEDLLPLLETLTLLEELFLWGLEMERVGREIMTFPFHRLKKLEFANCVRWEEWEDMSSWEEEEEDNDITSISFLPSLQELRLYSCSKLKCAAPSPTAQGQISRASGHFLLQPSAKSLQPGIGARLG